MNLSHATEDFLLAKRADGLAEKTIKWYVSNLGQFLAVFGDRPVKEVTTRQLREYIVEFQSQDHAYQDAPQKPPQGGGVSPDTVEARKRALHSFFSWCATEYSIDNPMKGIKRKKHKPRPKAMHPRDFVKLFDATLDNVAGIRDRALLAFIADTGCRLGGALGLTMSDLMMKQGRAVVTEKGSKPRMVYFTLVASRFIYKWLEVRETDSQHVFISLESGEQLSEWGAYEILKRLKARSGVTGKINPHSMRHHFARQYLMNGGDLVSLARLMGHADIKTTADAYAIFSDDELSEFHHKYGGIADLDIE